MQQGAQAARRPRPDEVFRRKRRLATVYRRRRIRLAIGFGILCLVVAGIIIALSVGGTTEQVGAQGQLVGGSRAPAAPVAADGEEHPAFARLGDRNMLLPVAARDATIIAYQAVSDERAVVLTPIGEQANANALVRFFRSIFSSPPAVRYYYLEGGAGPVTTSVLVGAAAGSPVTAPISGLVIAVKDYMLFGRYPDVQIDIQPEKTSGVTVSLLFIQDPSVSIGDLVTAGKTKLGYVRQCPDQLAASLAVYTHDAGAHVYMQATEEPVS
jgi:hypothetical protein